MQAQLSEARTALAAAQEAAATAEEKLEVTVASLTEQHEAATAALQVSYLIVSLRLKDATIIRLLS
jgi:hypothetical protein